MRPGRSIYGSAVAALILALGAGSAQQATAAASGDPGTGYSAAGLYNLANGYARDGKPGLAVLDYERARLLAPGDPDIQANLRHVLAAAGLPAVTDSWFDRHIGWAGSSTLFWLGCVGILLAGGSELTRRLSPRRRIVLRAASIAGIASVILALYAAATLWPVMSEAVVIAPTTVQRVAPATVAEPLSTLREAQIVRVEAQRQGFAMVRTSAGLTGWVLRADLEPIVPRSS